MKDRSADVRPIRVLHVIPCDDFAGTELLVASYVERLDPRVVRVEVATLAPRGPIAERLDAAGIETHSLGGSGLAVAAAGLAKLIRRRRFDVVNGHGFKATMLARLLVRLLTSRTAFITSVHALHVTEMEEIGTAKGRIVLALERLGSRLVDVYEINTRGAMSFFAERGFDPERLRHIPNAIDAAEWPYTGPPARDDRIPVIACVARMVPRKRHVDLMRALARLGDDGFACRAVFVGAGPTLEASRNFARELGIDGQIEFRGRATPNDVRAILQKADVFCLPSLWEGTVISVMEAMATGLPVVATAVNGIDEVVVDGTTGLLVPPYRDDCLANTIRAVLSDPERAKAMGRAGRERIEEHFRLDGIVRAKEQLYVTLAGRA
jgi:glycosyltransferase involved in cell wall biosynthesis